VLLTALPGARINEKRETQRRRRYGKSKEKRIFPEKETSLGDAEEGLRGRPYDKKTFFMNTLEAQV